MKTTLLRLLAILWVMFHAASAQGENIVHQATGQTIYVPVYSHIYGGLRSRPLDLTATLSIRNTDMTEPLNLTSVAYYDSDGKLVKTYLKKEQPLGPLATTHFIVEESDTSGGSGAKFVVQWKSTKPITPPVVECVMITIQSGLGISFVSAGRVLSETRP
jgi:hypothetical protein|uniref:DUF3124 domain-containing protein n=1 Tax=Desulfomonile tiedjei TaxID=2358 RepID=A0A7C4EUK1_9BACT